MRPSNSSNEDSDGWRGGAAQSRAGNQMRIALGLLLAVWLTQSNGAELPERVLTFTPIQAGGGSRDTGASHATYVDELKRNVVDVQVDRIAAGEDLEAAVERGLSTLVAKHFDGPPASRRHLKISGSRIDGVLAIGAALATGGRTIPRVLLVVTVNRGERISLVWRTHTRPISESDAVAFAGALTKMQSTSSVVSEPAVDEQPDGM